jgi:hypothetical protein
MKRLHKFYEYIKENAEWDQDAVNEMLLPIKDLGFEVQISDPIVVADPSSKIYKKMVREIKIWIKSEYNKDIDSGAEFFMYKENGQWDRNYTSDIKVFELLIEFGNLCSRLVDDGSAACISWTNSNVQLSLIQVLEEANSIENNEIELKDAFSNLRNKFYRRSGDFIHTMIFNPMEVSKVKDKFSILCGDFYAPFTKRRWSAFTKEVDLTKFDVTIEDIDDTETEKLSEYRKLVTISVKK